MKIIGHMLYDEEDVQVMGRLVKTIDESFLGAGMIVSAVSRLVMPQGIASEAREIEKDYGIDVRAANLSYEMSVLAQMPLSWCTSLAINGSMVKSLDWPIKAMKGKDRLIDFGDFVSVGYPGLLGVITGVRPGRYAITVNMDAFADIRHIAPLGTPVMFLIRACLEQAKTFDEAVQFVHRRVAAAPAFIHIVGTRWSTVVCTRDHSKLSVKAITNHNPTDDSLECDRLIAANRIVKTGSIRRFGMSPIRNSDTVCQHIIDVKTGDVRRV